MGQKVNPVGIRLGITRDWESKWYAGSKTFASNIHTDYLVRKYLMKKLADASVSHIHIERAARREFPHGCRQSLPSRIAKTFPIADSPYPVPVPLFRLQNL